VTSRPPNTGPAAAASPQRRVDDRVPVQHPAHVADRRTTEALADLVEGDVDDEQIQARLVMTFELTDLASYRSLMQAAKCGLVKLVGRRELLDTFIRVFSNPQTA
jgi:hypothetical protein